MGAQAKRRHVFSTDLPTIEAEIRTYREAAAKAEQSVGNVTLEIGKRLLFVKSNDLIHGKWLPWLASIGIESRTAQRYIQAYEQFGNTTCASHLTTGIMFDLLSMPAEINREDFLTQPQIVPSTGVMKLVTDMSQKERREVLRAAKGKSPDGRKDADRPKQTDTDAHFSGDVWAAIDAIATELNDYERSVLYELSLELVRRVLSLPLTSQKVVLNVASRLSARRFHDRADDIFEAVRAGKSADTIFHSFKLNLDSRPKSGYIDPYEVLGVSPSDSEREVKRKYREIVKKIHPDVGGSAFLFKIVHDAYENYLA